MERVPSPEDQEGGLRERLRLIDRAHIEQKLDDSGNYSVPLGTMYDTSPDSIATAKSNLNVIVDRLLRNYGIEPHDWANQTDSDTSVLPAPDQPVLMTAAEFLVEETNRNVFARGEDRWFGGCSLHFDSESTKVEIRGTSQFHAIRIYENPQTSNLVDDALDEPLVRVLREEYGELTVMHEGVESELTFTAIFMRKGEN